MAERDWGTEAGPLADRLSITHQHPSPSGKIGLCTCPKCPDMRAAAEGLRLLADLTALHHPEPSVIPGVDHCPTCHRQWPCESARLIADAG